jgi:hypothetical protein
MALLSVEVDGQLQAGLKYVMRTLSLTDDALRVTAVIVETTGLCVADELVNLRQEHLPLVFTDATRPQLAHLFGQIGTPATVRRVLPVPAATTRTSPVAVDLVVEKGGHRDHTRDENVVIRDSSGCCGVTHEDSSPTARPDSVIKPSTDAAPSQAVKPDGIALKPL